MGGANGINGAVHRKTLWREVAILVGVIFFGIITVLGYLRPPHNGLKLIGGPGVTVQLFDGGREVRVWKGVSEGQIKEGTLVFISNEDHRRYMLQGTWVLSGRTFPMQPHEEAPPRPRPSATEGLRAPDLY